MAKEQHIAENFDPEKIKGFRAMLDGAIQYAQQNNVPICVVEAAMRDVLSGVEASRLVISMRRNGGRI